MTVVLKSEGLIFYESDRHCKLISHVFNGKIVQHLKAESEQDQKNITLLCRHSGFLLQSQNSSSFSSRNGFWPKSHVGNEIIVNVHVGGCNNHGLISSRVSGARQRRVCATLSFTLSNLHRQWIGFFIKQEDLEILGSISWIDILEMSSKRSQPCAIPSLCCSVWSALSPGGKSLAHWQGQSPLEEWAD